MKWSSSPHTQRKGNNVEFQKTISGCDMVAHLQQIGDSFKSEGLRIFWVRNERDDWHPIKKHIWVDLSLFLLFVRGSRICLISRKIYWREKVDIELANNQIFRNTYLAGAHTNEKLCDAGICISTWTSSVKYRKTILDSIVSIVTLTRSMSIDLESKYVIVVKF